MLIEIVIIVLVAGLAIALSKLYVVSERLEKLERAFWETKEHLSENNKKTLSDPVAEKKTEEPLPAVYKNALQPPVNIPETLRIQSPTGYGNQSKTEAKQPKGKSKSRIFIEDNFLTIIGVVTFVLGIGYFVKYAIDKNWISETFRVFIGIMVGIILLGIAHRFKKQYRIFSSILVSGGISIFYVSITLAFQEYHLMGQQASFGMLTLITVLAIAMSLWYDRQELMVFSVVGGFLAPLMVSTGESNYVFLFSYLVLLNTASLYVFYKKEWYILPYISFILSTVYLLAWYFDDAKHVITVLYLVVVLYLQFIVFALIKLHTENEFKVGQLVLLLVNQFFFCLLLISIYDGYEFYICLLFVLPNVLLLLIFKNKNQLLVHTLYAFVMGLVTLAVPYQVTESSVSVCWLVFASILLFVFEKSQNKIFFYGYCAIAFCSILSLLQMWIVTYVFLSHPWKLGNTVFINGVIFSVLMGFNLYRLKQLKGGMRNVKNIMNRLFYTQTFFTLLILYMVTVTELSMYSIKMLEESFKGIPLLFTLCYFTLPVAAYKWLELNKTARVLCLIFGFLLTSLYVFYVHAGSEFILNKGTGRHFMVYLIYILPLGYYIYIVYKENYFKEIAYLMLQWFVLIQLISILSLEGANIYSIVACREKTVAHYNMLQDQYRLIVLPILWVIIAFILLFTGLRNKIKVWVQMAYVLISICILKLYLLDVWEMDHVSRIIAFVVLGILFLMISFSYQKWHKMVKKIIEK